MSRKAKWGIVGGIVLLVAVGVGAKVATAGNKGTEVRIEPVEARDLVASVTASGQIQPRTKVDLSSDITGRITRLAVKEGQMVTKGQFLLRIDPAQAQAAVQRAEAALASARAQSAQAKANYLQAQRDFERTAEIKKQNPALITDAQVEQLRTQVEVTRALQDAATYTVEQAAASLREARNALSKTTIVAPMSGRVTRLNVEEGETAIMGTLNKDAATLLTIADMGVLETKIKVDETDVSHISIGDSAVVQIDAFPDTVFVGRVVEISNSAIRAAAQAAAAADQAVDYEVTIQLLDAPPETRPDFSATAKVITDTRRNVLSIPIIALTVREREEDAPEDEGAATLGRRAPQREVGQRDVEGVFVVGDDSRVTFRPVRVGIAGERHFEVISGLQANERIVAGTYQAIRELRDSTLVREAPQPKQGE